LTGGQSIRSTESSAALNTGGKAQITSVSCAAAGNCSVGGNYTDSSGHYQAFVDSQITWGTAEEVPGIGNATIESVSCAAAGACTAGGDYTDSSGADQALVVSEVGGSWGQDEEVPGIGTLNTGGLAFINSVSCTSAGNCSAGGSYNDSSQHTQVFVDTQSDGTWGTAEEVPGTAKLNKGGYAQISAVSCTSAGNCIAAEEVPGTGALNTGGSDDFNSVSCVPAGTCSAGGYYYDSSGILQGFVDSQI
jgi:hypothetical protein